MRFRYHKPIPDAYEVANPKNPKREISVKDFKSFEDLAHDFGVDGIRYSKLSEEFKKEWDIDFDNVITLIYIISDDILKMKQSKEKAILLDDEFQDIGRDIYRLADFLRSSGYEANILHPLDDRISLRAIAMQSNDCAILRSNMCLFKEGLASGFFQIATSIDNLPFKDENEMLWVEDYCKDCGNCIKKCPHDAYDENEKVIKKVCLAHHEGCSVCMLKCPFYKKGYDKIKEKYFKKLKKKR
ncbi:MAG: 4Fe-4S binding protein [Methanobrevibacter sp.]|uniref:4Fe-4S binding protein n=1 Tax=Methanobrevibacter sp. TaxID=66852 RepID=UPI0026E02896|nr:4Fe-4S binding protein [Methanobrevibacter sp.]MDO5848426.1 4Fe-4S binding protein [Methanobrevibacter sp.]